HPQKSRLAAPRRPEQREKRAALDAQRNVVDRRGRTKTLRGRGDFKQRHPGQALLSRHVLPLRPLGAERVGVRWGELPVPSCGATHLTLPGPPAPGSLPLPPEGGEGQDVRGDRWWRALRLWVSTAGFEAGPGAGAGPPGG